MVAAIAPEVDAAEIDLFARTGAGVAPCPCSTCRLGSRIAPVRAMLRWINSKICCWRGVSLGLSSAIWLELPRRQRDEANDCHFIQACLFVQCFIGGAVRGVAMAQPRGA